MRKPNPILAAFERKLRDEFESEKKAMREHFRRQLAVNTEINMISMIISGNDLGFIGSKRAWDFCVRQLEVKKQLAGDIMNDDSGGLIYTKHDVATRLKEIFGREGWIACRELFPLLYEYWEWEA